MRRIWSRIFLVVLCLALLAGNVFAGETTLILRFRPIESGVCAIDSIYGVSANYQNGATIYCSELITRFYQTLYGVDVLVGDGPIVTGDDADTYWFEPTTSPVAGDVAYAAPAKRGKGYPHYALVKYANAKAGTVTLMEQNWSWNGTVSPWAKSAVQRADALGVTSGLVGGYRRTITRGVLARLCVNTAELNGFKVDQTNPYGAACALGVMNTDETGEFAPWASVTRADAAITLTRLLALVGEVPAARQSVLFALTDAAEIPSAARSSVAAMLASGLMSAESGCFRPNDPITTEQVLSVLVQILDDPAPVDLSASGSNAAADARQPAGRAA